MNSYSCLSLRKLLLIKCWKQKRQAYTIYAVCSLHSHIIGHILAFQIGSNLVGPLMVSKGKSFHTKKSMTSRMTFKEPEEIYTSLRCFAKLQCSTILLSYTSRPSCLVSSIQSQACVFLLHVNSNRAGLNTIGLMNLYTWAFGLTCSRVLLALKRICDPTFNMIRGLFVCT
jgi:hypothetical protein